MTDLGKRYSNITVVLLCVVIINELIGIVSLKTNYIEIITLLWCVAMAFLAYTRMRNIITFSMQFVFTILYVVGLPISFGKPYFIYSCIVAFANIILLVGCFYCCEHCDRYAYVCALFPSGMYALAALAHWVRYMDMPLISLGRMSILGNVILLLAYIAFGLWLINEDYTELIYDVTSLPSDIKYFGLFKGIKENVLAYVDAVTESFDISNISKVKDTISDGLSRVNVAIQSANEKEYAYTQYRGMPDNIPRLVDLNALVNHGDVLALGIQIGQDMNQIVPIDANDKGKKLSYYFSEKTHKVIKISCICIFVVSILFTCSYGWYLSDIDSYEFQYRSYKYQADNYSDKMSEAQELYNTYDVLIKLYDYADVLYKGNTREINKVLSDFIYKNDLYLIIDSEVDLQISIGSYSVRYTLEDKYKDAVDEAYNYSLKAKEAAEKTLEYAFMREKSYTNWLYDKIHGTNTLDLF